MSRAVYRLTDLDGSNAWSTPVIHEEMTRPLRAAVQGIVGADGGFDLHGLRRAPMDPGRAAVEIILNGSTQAALQTAIDAARAGILGNRIDRGLRKYWRWETADGSAGRWTYARPVEVTDAPKDRGSLLVQRMRAEFLLPEPVFYQSLAQADYDALSLTNEAISSALFPTGTGALLNPDYRFAKFTVTASPTTFTLTNNGSVETRRIVFYLVAQASNGWTNPAIENTTTGQKINITDSSPTTSTRLCINCASGLGAMDKSTDGGSAWTDATVSLDLGSVTQAVLMELWPGANSFSVTSGGTPNFLVYAQWFPSYWE